MGSYRREDNVEDYLVTQVTTRLQGNCRKLRDEGRNGFPDRTVLWAGAKIHFVEVKSPDVGAVLRPEQIRTIKRLRKLGFGVSVVSTKAQVDKLINRLERV